MYIQCVTLKAKGVTVVLPLFDYVITKKGSFRDFKKHIYCILGPNRAYLKSVGSPIFFHLDLKLDRCVQWFDVLYIEKLNVKEQTCLFCKQ